MGRILGTLALSTLIFAQSAQAGDSRDFLEDASASRPRRVKIDLASLDARFGVKIADLNFFEGLSLSARYQYAVEPSYQGGYFTRIDSYQLKVGISPGDFFDSEDLPVYMKIERGSEIIFVRQFKSQAEALTKLPVFDPRRIPLNSKLAIEHMRPGDFVAIPATMSIAIGANATYPIVPGLSASVGGSFGVLSGKFRLHVFRLDDDRVRLRLISDHGRNWSASAGIKSDYEFFDVSIADNLVSKFIKADLPKLTHTQAWGDLVLLDYVYDLKKEEVRSAYDRVLKSTFKFRFRDLAVMESLRDKMVSDLLETERIRLEDMNLPPEQQRIRRLFSGDNAYRYNQTRLVFGSSFIKMEGGLSNSENRVTYFNRYDQPTNYSYLTSNSSRSAGISFNLFRFQRNASMSSLVSTPDNGGQNSVLENINLSFEVKDKYISQKQSDGLIDSLQKVTNGQIVDDELFESWKNAEKIRDGRFLIDLWITKQGLSQIEGMSAAEIAKRFSAYLDHQEPELIRVASTKGAVQGEAQRFSKFYRLQILDAAENLAKVLDPKRTGTQRGRAYVKLKNNLPFERMGTGFLISLMDPQQLDRSVLLRVRAYANSISEIRKVYGRAENLDLLNSLQYMQYVMGNGYFDPRWDPIPDSRQP